MAAEHEEHSRRSDHVVEKLAQAANAFQNRNNVEFGRFFQQAMGSIFGMVRDYGDMPRWFRLTRWEHEYTQIPESRLTETLKSYGDSGWQLASATVRHPNAHPEVMWVLIFKRPH